MPLDKTQIDQAKKFRQEQDAARLSESMGYAAQVDPSVERIVDRHAKALNAPRSVVRDNLQEVEDLSTRNAVDVARLQQESPKTAEWMADPVRAGLSRDDLDVMQSYERHQSRQDIPFWTNTARGVGERLNTLTGDLMEFAGNVSGDFERKLRDLGVPNPGIVFGEDGVSWSWDVDTAEEGNALKTVGRGVSEGGLGYEANFTWDDLKGAPTVENIVGFIFETGAQSIADMAAIIATLPAYLASRTQEIAEQRVVNKGGDPNEQVDTTELLEALPTAVAVALTERYATRGALGAFADKVGKVTLGHAGREVGKAIAREAGTEFVQEQLEYAGEVVGTGVQWDIKQSLDRGFAGAVAGGPVGGVVRTLSLPRDAAVTKLQDDVVRGLNSVSEQESLDGMVDSIQNMKLSQEAPERAAEFLKNASGNDKIYITPEEVKAAVDEGLPVPQYMRDAADGTTDVELSVDQFALDVVASEELLTRLRPHLKRSPETLTQAELQNRDNSHLDRLLKDAKDSEEIRTEAEEVHDTVTEQLIATGRMSSETARLSASIVPAFVTTKVAELRARGIETSVSEVYKKMGFRVDPGTGRKTASKQREVLNQEVAQSQALEAVKDTAVRTNDTQEPLRLYQDPDANTEGVEGAVYLRTSPIEAEGQDSAYVDIKNPMVLDGTAEDTQLSWSEEDIQSAKDQGYDGIWIKNPDMDAVIAFDEGQVKSIPAVTLDQETVPSVPDIQAELSLYEQLLSCTRAA